MVDGANHERVEDSPVSNNGRGLKLGRYKPLPAEGMDSPVSNNGRGLKRQNRRGLSRWPRDSPVSNNGRGLKPDAEFGHDPE